MTDQGQPDAEKLSASIGATIKWLTLTEALTGEQVASLVGFLHRHLPHLQVFAADMEFVESLKGRPQAMPFAAAASMRLYKRITAVGEPIIAVRVPADDLPSSLPMINLDRFRRQPPIEGGEA
ncbi:MAG: hypothetical protein NTV97_33960 [Alphaproteobacteria bacterium]|nr:hypothetical protein [Alphaproteobacteria bacterium]